MTLALLVGIAGLAVLDALNPATIVGVSLILLLPGHRPVATASAFIAGAYVTVLGAGVAVYLAADAAAGIPGGLQWVRRSAFGVVAVIVLVAAVRRLRHRQRQPIALPAWLTVRTAAPLGLLATAADLPNAFPYFIAIERLVSAGVSTATGILVLAGYAFMYCLPCLLLLAAGAAWGQRVRGRLDALYRRYGREKTVPRSIPAALGLAIVGVVLAQYAVSG